MTDSKKIWIVTQLRDGSLHPMAREALAAGRHLAEAAQAQAEAVILGAGDESAVGEVAGLDLAGVKAIESPELATYTPGAYVAALAAAIAEHTPVAVVFPHSYQSVDYVPRLAHAVDASLVPEVISFRREDEEWIFRRPVFGGKLQADVRVLPGGGPTFVTVQSGAFAAGDLGPGQATVDKISPGPLASDREILGVEEVAGEQVDLTQADIIVAVGRGIGGPENMALVEELAAALGGEIGASRPVIDNGWLPRDRQIGSSGQTVAPKLYLAVGISGAIQHLVGMKGSQTVVAINKDASAPIFGISEYGIVGDLHEVVPALIEAVKEARAG